MREITNLLPDQIKQITTAALEMDGIRTSCLGLGPSSNEDLMSMISAATGGNFHNANSAESLPAIFKEELDGLQQISAQNVRARIQKLDFCDEFQPLTGYPFSVLPDRRVEYSIGDLVSQEEKILVLQLNVLALPLLPDNTPVASLEGETLLKLEVLYDEFGEKGIASIQQEQVVRILAAQKAEEVKVNEAVIPWVALQKAGKALEQATQEVDQNNAAKAKKTLQIVMEDLAAYRQEGKVTQAIGMIQQFIEKLKGREWNRKEVKHMTTSLKVTGRIELPPSLQPPPKKKTTSAGGTSLT